MRRSSRSLITIALAAGLGACAQAGDGDDLEEEVGDAVASARIHRLRVAWLNSDPSNTYDAANLDGVITVAQAANATVTPFYSYFDPTLQLQQCLQVVAAGQHDTMVIIPVDAVGIIPCVKAAKKKGIPVVASDLPIGPDITTTQPQVAGQAGAVLVPPATWGDELTPLVVDLCAGRNPCNVLYIAGSFDVANDQVAIAALEVAAASHPGLNLIADQAFYDPGLAFAITEATLATTEVHVVIGAGDQMAQGAEGAIAASSQTTPVKIIGAGAGAYGMQAVRDGRWYGTFMAVPRDVGMLSALIAILAALPGPFPQIGIDPIQLRGFPSFFTSDNQAEFGNFQAQWPG